MYSLMPLKPSYVMSSWQNCFSLMVASLLLLRGFEMKLSSPRALLSLLWYLLPKGKAFQGDLLPNQCIGLWGEPGFDAGSKEPGIWGEKCVNHTQRTPGRRFVFRGRVFQSPQISKHKCLESSLSPGQGALGRLAAQPGLWSHDPDLQQPG